MATIRLFENASHAKLYSRFRPTYPKGIYEAIDKFLKKHGISPGTAVDIGCGSGQSTFSLSTLFHRCIGTDISEAQIACAREKARESTHENVDFVTAAADSLPIADKSVDVVTCGQAWHWLDPVAVNPEIDRVLKEPGCLAVYGYARGVLLHPKCEALLDHFFTRTLADYWHPNRKLVDNHFRDIQLPFSVAERHDITSHQTLRLSDFIGYLSTASAYHNLCEKLPGNTILADLADDMKAALEDTGVTGNGDIYVDVSTPMFLILCVKKRM